MNTEEYGTLVVEPILHAAFGIEWNALSERQRFCVAADLSDMAESEDLSLSGAAVELRRRIGGPINLASYADCQVARFARA